MLFLLQITASALYWHRHLQNENFMENILKTSIFWISGVLFLIASQVVKASPGLDSLNYFFQEIQSFEAEFGQVILDESLTELDRGQGKVWVERPGLFRWNYEYPDLQEIVGDGTRVWIYDIDLEQVSVRPQDEAIGRSPAVLLSGTQSLEENFSVIDIGTQGPYDWINLVALDEENEFREIRIGFEDNRLRLMELVDHLEQRTRIVFHEMHENIEIPDSRFEFIPPEGVDVIDEFGLLDS